MEVFLGNMQTLITEHQKRLEQDQKERATMQESFTQCIESSSAALTGLVETVRSSTMLINEDITKSLIYYSKLSSNIQEEATASTEAIESLQNSLSRLGAIRGSEPPLKE